MPLAAATASAEPRPVPVLTVKSYKERDLRPVLLEQLGAQGEKKTRVLRIFSKSRLPNLLATGTDRDNSSEHWTWRVDSDDATRARNGIDQAHLTYAADLDVSKTSNFHFHNTLLGPLFSNTADYWNGRSKDVLAVYAWSGLVRASRGDRKRASDAEFWFKGRAARQPPLRGAKRRKDERPFSRAPVGARTPRVRTACR